MVQVGKCALLGIFLDWRIQHILQGKGWKLEVLAVGINDAMDAGGLTTGQCVACYQKEP